MDAMKSPRCKRLQLRERSQFLAVRDQNVTFSARPARPDTRRRQARMLACSDARAAITRYAV
jgi:hypothetical protein